MIPHKVSVKST